MSDLDYIVFKEIRRIAEREIPNTEEHIKELKQRIIEEEKLLQEKLNIVSEACERFGYKLRKGNLVDGERKYVLEKPKEC